MPLPRPMLPSTVAALKEHISYDPESGLLTWKRQRGRALVGDVAGTLESQGYIIFTFDRVIYKAHRVAWLLHNGVWHSGQIDHINGHKSDNRIINLRAGSCSDNQQNRKRHRSGDHVGVYLDKEYGGWIARAPRNFLKRRASKYKYLGYFKTKEEAGQAIIDYCSTNEN